MKALRLLFVADGRSPIALNWIQYFVDAGHEVHLASTFPAAAHPRLASFTFLPAAFSQFKTHETSAGRIYGRRRSSSVRILTLVRQWFGPLTLSPAARQLRTLAESISPDCIHAMRIPYEGMLASLSEAPFPLLVSVWGNDFTLHARSTPVMRRLTLQTLARASALHADCWRDVRLAREWGFGLNKPAYVFPGAGGVQSEIFYPPPQIVSEPVLIQPRGVRAYVQTLAFVDSLLSVVRECPDVRVLCPNMAGEASVERRLADLGIAGSVDLLPAQSRQQMAQLFRASRVIVSPTTHDGTPNTLLEGLACGCLPVAGDLESLREWIDPGVNGLLVDPTDPARLAKAILRGLTDDALCRAARKINLQRVARFADYANVMREATQMYQRLAG